MNHADGTAPIYAELIRERGDVPGDVRQVAEEVLRDLSRVIQMPPQGVPGPQGAVAHAGAMAHPGAMAHQGAQVGALGHPGAQAHGNAGGAMGVGGPVGQAGAVLPHRPMR
ncbi:hypothetical protein R6L23_26180 [Streptomyces sp. SR27]|uniref:hypothetical protein n=1 Tax=unclassified Streptomyces TaxID=2593676 RepID=UPI00295BC479|nr:hypothetical protein [Streptomyces sp. SR27]MDV9191655.1 hypothetical protein [Streptomyces sp. SR27]